MWPGIACDCRTLYSSVSVEVSTPVCSPLLGNPLSKQSYMTWSPVSLTAGKRKSLMSNICQTLLIACSFYSMLLHWCTETVWTGCEMPILRELQNAIGQGPRQSDLALMVSMPWTICSTKWPPITPSHLLQWPKLHWKYICKITAQKF